VASCRLGAGRAIPFDDSADLVRKLDALLAGSELDSLAQHRDGTRPPSWRDHARETLDFVAECLDGASLDAWRARDRALAPWTRRG
jgi:hypothetical protein